MIQQLDEVEVEVEDLWDEVAETTRTCGPDDPRDGSLLKDWSNVVSIKCIVIDTLAAIQIRALGTATKIRHTQPVVLITR